MKGFKCIQVCDIISNDLQRLTLKGEIIIVPRRDLRVTFTTNGDFRILILENPPQSDLTLVF